MSDTKIEKLEDYLLKLTEDVATVKAKLDIIEDIKNAIDNIHTVESDIELLRLTVTSIENRLTKLEDSIQEDDKYKNRSIIGIIFTVIATIVGGMLLEQFIK